MTEIRLKPLIILRRFKFSSLKITFKTNKISTSHFTIRLTKWIVIIFKYRKILKNIFLIIQKKTILRSFLNKIVLILILD